MSGWFGVCWFGSSGVVRGLGGFSVSNGAVEVGGMIGDREGGEKGLQKEREGEGEGGRYAPELGRPVQLGWGRRRWKSELTMPPNFSILIGRDVRVGICSKG